MLIKIENDQAKATWSEVEVNAPSNLVDAVALYGADVAEVIYQFAMEKSNFNVRMRSLIKNADDAQTIVDNFFKGLVASAMTVNDMTVRLVALVGELLLTADMVAPFFTAKSADAKKTLFKALLVKADVARDNKVDVDA